MGMVDNDSSSFVVVVVVVVVEEEEVVSKGLFVVFEFELSEIPVAAHLFEVGLAFSLGAAVDFVVDFVVLAA